MIQQKRKDGWAWGSWFSTFLWKPSGNCDFIDIHISVVVFDHFVVNQALRHGNGRRVEFVNNLFWN